MKGVVRRKISELHARSPIPLKSALNSLPIAAGRKWRDAEQNVPRHENPKKKEGVSL
jgi:hypothetical protein